MLARCYLRASSDEQNASRAREQVEAFAAERGLVIASTYIENESGAKLARPELFRLIANSRPGDVLLIEQVDRLSRLTASDWQKLRAELDAKQVRVIAMDLPTSWMLAAPADDFTARMFGAVNAMMLDVLAAMARGKDYDDRRRRQAQGVSKAKEEGKYHGRPENTGRTQASRQCCALEPRGAASKRPLDAPERHQAVKFARVAELELEQPAMRLSFSGRGKREPRLRPGQRNEAHGTAVAPHREPDCFLPFSPPENGRSSKEVHDLSKRGWRGIGSDAPATTERRSRRRINFAEHPWTALQVILPIRSPTSAAIATAVKGCL